MLFLEERNTDQHTSIIFLHGGAGSHVEWKVVAKQESLASYHLILVDLPGHSGSEELKSYTLEAAADETEKMIREHARGGKAHVVGFSFGGFVALKLAPRHPDGVLSLFSTGAYPYTGMFKWAMSRPRLVWFLENIEIPGLTAMMFRKQGIDNEEWIAETEKNASWDRFKVMVQELSNFCMDDVRAVAESGVRTLVIAGGKMDQVDAIAGMGLVLKESAKTGVENKAVVVREGYHPWHIQLPVLFAAGVQAWVSGSELPKDFEQL
ncbi:alpha beta hydrolase fold protein [Grosmannia clavigera kw1407]|uniref:Alpha beta hydrolase fold protein n=1 Tax=Grosmannia clavigera (strain kw1407 / UAMH 11150) TaxID=655863 RepID=F0XMS2_GROCL|nr:alpha beta hydrolase fold protein [Grosmannia clavigera kw1407]EFX01033.1 alpha beta hydrolase fold protein [Grosmannia clavigera kw1407]